MFCVLFFASLLHNFNLHTGGACDLAIRALAKAWRKLMAFSDSELDIDPEYTRPGMIDLLNKFKDKIADIPDQSYYKFNWDGSYDDEEEEEEEQDGDENSVENDMDLDDDDDDSDDDDDDSEDEDDEDWGEEEEEEEEEEEGGFDMVCNDTDSEVPQELLQRAMDAYSKCVVNIPEDSDSD
jgi:hypothetical protein